jgi:tetratricopeptide (TPR) repeat protein
MPTPAQREARAALDVARPAVARLDESRGSEDLAADLIEIWDAIETSLRALVGSTALGGHSLIREARQRQLIGFDQANGIAEFEAVHTRLQDVSYRPNASDVSSARNAFLKLDAALIENAAAPSPFDSRPVQPPAAAPTPAGEPVAVRTQARSRPRWLVPTIAVAVVAILAIGGWLMFGPRGTSALNDGVAAYQRGQREVAISAFNKAVRENPKDALPHVYLARMAREVGNFSLASNELQLALEADPNSAVALREMGANLLQQGNAELARRFYVRAVQADPTDKTSQGYLGCALYRLGRTQEAQTFINRAGPGPWSSCVASANTGQPAQVPPGASIPR